MKPIKFAVHGIPQQRGSKTFIGARGGGFLLKRQTEKAVLVNRGNSLVLRGAMPLMKDENKASRAWMDAVAMAARSAYSGPLLDEPLCLGVVFFMPRPASHLGTGRNEGTVKASAKEFHDQLPDLSKLVRCLEDALTDVIWTDDKLVCQYDFPRKVWTAGQPGALVEISAAVAEDVENELPISVPPF